MRMMYPKVDGRVNKDRYVDTGCYLPTPEEIAAGCAEVRAGWDEATRNKRAARTGGAVELPVIADQARAIRRIALSRVIRRREAHSRR